MTFLRQQQGNCHYTKNTTHALKNMCELFYSFISSSHLTCTKNEHDIELLEHFLPKQFFFITFDHSKSPSSPHSHHLLYRHSFST